MPALPRNPSSMTKERLTEELKRNNIPLPRGRSKKEVYVELYQKHLLDGEASPQWTAYRNMSVNTSPKFGFSSDEEDDIVVKRISKPALNTNNNRIQKKASKKGNQTLFEDRLAEVEELSDVDLRRELQLRGFKAGPIVGTTRAVYERKLADLLIQPEQEQDEVVEENGDGEETPEEEVENGYSDSDVDEESHDVQTQSTRSVSSRTTSSYKSQVTKQMDRESSSSARQRHITPKRQTETVKTEQVTKTSHQKTDKKGKPLVPVWLQLLIFAIVATFLILIWYNMETGQTDATLLT